MAPDRPLSGLRVLELCEYVTGPFCAKMLADLGAEVVKIEPPSGDPARRKAPFYQDRPHPERSGLFLYVNLNKKGITLDITSATGRNLFRELAARADVLIEDRPPGALEEMGLGYRDLEGVNPRLIVASVTPFGQTGPHRRYKADHLVSFQAAGEGYMLRAEPIDRPPVQAGQWMGDFEAAVGVAVAVMVALYWRGLSGQGQHIDISKQEWGMALYNMFITCYRNEGKLESRATQTFPWAGTMRCSDGYVCLLPNEEHHWKAFVEWMGHPAWADDPRFQTARQRAQNGPEITRLVAQWVAPQSKHDLQREGQARGVPIAIFSTPQDLLDSAQMKARGFFVEVDHPEVGRHKYPYVPYQLSETPARYERPAPTLGQHNAEVYGGLLGCSREDLARLRAQGAI